MINGFARYYTHYVFGRGRPRNAVHRSRSLFQGPPSVQTATKHPYTASGLGRLKEGRDWMMIMIVQKEKEEGGRQFSMVVGRSTCIASISIRQREK